MSLKSAVVEADHKNDCQYKDRSIPINECNCYCYEQHIWNAALVEAVKVTEARKLPDNNNTYRSMHNETCKHIADDIKKLTTN